MRELFAEARSVAPAIVFIDEIDAVGARRGETVSSGERDQMAHVIEGVDRALLGVASRATVMSDDERRRTAYHEAGHALVRRALPGASPPHRVTIVPTGNALGHCSSVDDHDRVLYSRSWMLDLVASVLGGWVAERLVFGENASGCSNDLERADALARQMVCELGMTERLGPRVFAKGLHQRSDEMAQEVDNEVGRIIEEARSLAEGALKSERAALDLVADTLLERESLTSAELDTLVTSAAAPMLASRRR